MLLNGAKVEVRWSSDYAALRLVHAACFPHEAWTEKDFQLFLEKRPGQIVRAITLVRDDKPVEVIGSLLTRAMDDTMQIARVGVLPDYRHQGVALYALRTIVGPESPVRRRFYTARIHERNTAAVHLFKQADFKYHTTQIVKDDAGERQDDLWWFRFVKPEPTRRRRVHAGAKAIMP